MDNLKNKCIMFKNIKRLIALKSESKVHYAQRANSSQDINAECKQLHDTFDKSIPTDLVIKVGVRSIYVNKFVLQNCSSYFKKVDRFITSEDGQETAQTYNNKIVQEYCFEFFIENTTHVINTDSFKELDEYTRSTFINKAKEVYGYYKI
ncbi:hypothetical protein ALC56_13794 [Trachymyrmex septentrionalis]|uniref:BTB domain-containing protein n=1 Tax=Trachymyrmex septentrionalis TaxID=34720 RepID=A0A151JTA5_9HYME|nr:hypothetical protein ALC56_13794 [Trachymyrmex septentrionalis]